MTSQFYLEAMNQLKDLNEAREIKEISMKKENRKLKLEILGTYGMVRNIENLVFERDVDYDIATLVDVLRMNLEEFVEKLMHLKLV